MRHSLKNGQRVLIRPIEPRDKGPLEAGLHNLSDVSVYRRFLSPKTHFTKAELRYLTEVDGHDHAAFVAVLGEGEHERGVGVARWVRLGDDPDAAEAAIVVADALQGQGLGSLLADRLALTAAQEDVRRFTATMLSDNHAAHRLMERLSDDLERRHDGAGHEQLTAALTG